MSVTTQSVQVCTEVQALMNIVIGLVADVKAGKGAAALVGDAVPGLISALSGLGDLQSEAADHKDLEVTVALGVAALTNALVG